MLQKSIVPWLVSIFGVHYPTQITAHIVRQMVGALVKRDVKGLGERFDALVDKSRVSRNFRHDCQDGFYNDFFKMLGYFYGDIVGLEGESGLRSDQPGRRRVSKGDDFKKAAPAPAAPAAPAPSSRGEWCPPRRRASHASCR